MLNSNIQQLNIYLNYSIDNEKKKTKGKKKKEMKKERNSQNKEMKKLKRAFITEETKEKNFDMETKASEC